MNTVSNPLYFEIVCKCNRLKKAELHSPLPINIHEKNISLVCECGATITNDNAGLNFRAIHEGEETNLLSTLVYSYKVGDPVMAKLATMFMMKENAWLPTTDDIYYRYLETTPPLFEEDDFFMFCEPHTVTAEGNIYPVFGRIYNAVHGWRCYCKLVPGNRFSILRFRSEIIYQVTDTKANVPSAVMQKCGGGRWVEEPIHNTVHFAESDFFEIGDWVRRTSSPQINNIYDMVYVGDGYYCQISKRPFQTNKGLVIPINYSKGEFKK